MSQINTRKLFATKLFQSQSLSPVSPLAAETRCVIFNLILTRYSSLSAISFKHESMLMWKTANPRLDDVFSSLNHCLSQWRGSELFTSLLGSVLLSLSPDKTLLVTLNSDKTHFENSQCLVEDICEESQFLHEFVFSTQQQSSHQWQYHQLYVVDPARREEPREGPGWQGRKGGGWINTRH